MLPSTPPSTRKRHRDSNRCQTYRSGFGRGLSRKRARSDEIAALLRGGALPGNSAFLWPYYPVQTKASVVRFLHVYIPYIEQLLKTRENDNRSGILSPREVNQVNELIRNNLVTMKKIESGTWKAFHPVRFMLQMFDFLNCIVITNKTKNTLVWIYIPRLDCKLAYNVPYCIQAQAACMITFLHVSDMRRGGSAAGPPRMVGWDRVTHRRDGKKIIVQIAIDRNFRNNIKLEVDWIGPHEFLRNADGSGREPWTAMAGMTVTRQEYIDYPVPPNQQLQMWMRYFVHLIDTKKQGCHNDIDADVQTSIIAEAERKFEAYRGLVKGPLPLNFDEDFSTFMGAFRVINLTKGTVVLLRMHETVIACTYLTKQIIHLRKLTFICSAEVQSEETDNIFETVTYNMCMSNVVKDSICVSIDCVKFGTVLVKVQWLGPQVHGMTSSKYDEIFGSEGLKEWDDINE